MNVKPLLRAAAIVVAGTLPVACLNVPVKREPPPAPFAGTKWVLVTERQLPGEAPYLEFGDGALTGYSGCNRIFGRYLQDTLGAGAIVFSSLATSKRRCDDVLMAVEDRILAVLGTSTNVLVTGNTLHIDGSAGALDFRAAPRPLSAAPR